MNERRIRMSKRFVCAMLFSCTAVFCLFASGCIDDGETIEDAGPGDSGSTDDQPIEKALVVTTDYQTGSYSTVDLTTEEVIKDIDIIHPDTICSFDPTTEMVFLIQRLNSDSIVTLDPSDGFSVTGEYSVGFGSNPQDIAVVSPERAYISLYADTKMLAVHPTDGNVVDEIDLSAYADADGLPEVSGLLYLDDKVYAVVQRLDTNNFFEPTDYSLLLVINASTGVVEDEIELTAANPSERLRFSSVLNRLVLIETGSYMSLDDGGIELFNPEDKCLSGLLVTESALGGNIVDVVIASESKGFAIIGVSNGATASTHLVSFDLSTGDKIKDILTSEEWAYDTIEMSPDGQELWVSDRTSTSPGIRIFDAASDSQKTSSPIDVGLPPGSICFVE
jgi:hypothetical protein